MIGAVVFDCFGVLTTEKWLAFVDQLPQTVRFDQLHELHRLYNLGRVDRKYFQEQVFKITGQNFNDDPLDTQTPVKNQKVFDLIRQLKSKKLKIGLLSNAAGSWVKTDFLTRNEQSLFDVIVLSSEVDLVKPDPAIFRLVCDRLEVKPEEAILIDDIELYCEEARKIGMLAIHYQNFEQTYRQLKAALVS